MTTSQIKKPSNSLSHILGRVWEEILSNNVAAPLFARLLSPQYLTSGGGFRYWSCPHSEHWKPLTDRGHWGSESGVTVSHGTWGYTDRELWDSVGLVSALVTGRNAAAALKAAMMTEAAVTFYAVLKFQTCPFPYIQRPRCSYSCCL